MHGSEAATQKNVAKGALQAFSDLRALLAMETVMSNDLVFYSSENGDQWLLIRGGTKGATVRHQPNVSSGGQSHELDLQDFLSREHSTPQGAALRRVIDDDDLGSS